MISTQAFLDCLMFLAALMLTAAFYTPCWERSGLRRDLRRLAEAISGRIQRSRSCPRSSHGPAARALNPPPVELTSREEVIWQAIERQYGTDLERLVPQQRNSNEGER